MKWSLALAVLLSSGAQAGAAGSVMLQGPMPQVLTAPDGRAGFTPAPVPNVDAEAPRAKDGRVKGVPELGASLSQPSATPLRPGDGYSPGSTYSEDLQRRNRSTLNVAPGLLIKVPTN